MSGLLALASTLPQCAISCLLTAVGTSSCAISDQACLCHDEGLSTQATACIKASCTVREALSTKNLTSVSCGIAPNTGPSYVPVFMALTALCAVSVLLRVVARLKAGYPVWWDDFIITLSFVGSTLRSGSFQLFDLSVADADHGSCSLSARLHSVHHNSMQKQVYKALVIYPSYTQTLCLANPWSKVRPLGLGTDIWAVSFDNITLIFKMLYCGFVLYITSRHLVRLSLLLFYYRLFGHIPLARRLIWPTSVLVIAFCIAFDFSMLFGCTPIEHFWNSWDGQHSGHCISFHGIFWAGAIIDIATDLWIMLIPVPFIMQLKLSLRKRILSSIMFAFGIFVLVVSLYRLTTIDRFTLSSNPTADFLDVGTWSGLELYVGIICACLPNFNTLLKPVYAWMGSRAQSPRPSGNEYGVGGSRSHRRGQEEEEFGIRATTVIDVEEHSSHGESMSIDRGDGLTQDGAVYMMHEIEGGTSTVSTTCGRAWS